MYLFLAIQALAIAGWLGYIMAGKRFTARQEVEIPEIPAPVPALLTVTSLDAGTLDADSASDPTARVQVNDSEAGGSGDTPQWLDTVVVEPGTRLTLLSLSYYGDKVFWVYVYLANRDVIKDPNRVPAGISLRIPMPDRYRIDAADKESVARAVRLQQEILAGNVVEVNELDGLIDN